MSARPAVPGSSARGRPKLPITELLALPYASICAAPRQKLRKKRPLDT